jgi:hypothetical protein
MFPGTGKTHLRFIHSELAPVSNSEARTRKTSSGNIFSIKPRITCVACNTGWINQFETDVRKFIEPILLGKFHGSISRKQADILSAWICLIIINLEYAFADAVCISASERAYLKRHRKPPENWAIFLAGSNGPIWSRAASHWEHRAFLHTDPIDLVIGQPFGRPNSQVTSMGMGKLFVHAFSSPVGKFVGDFEIAARARGMTQIWPPRGVIWPLTQRHTKLPPKLTLTDDEAFIVADSFANRLDALTGKMRPIP